MRNLWLVARREYTERVRTPAFLVTTVLVFLALVVGPLVPGLTAGPDLLKPLNIVVADTTDANLLARLQPGADRMAAHLLQAASTTEANLAESVRSGDADAYLRISGRWPSDFKAVIRAGGVVSQGRVSPLAQAVVALAQADRAEALGIDPAAAAHVLAHDADISVGPLSQGDNDAPFDAARFAVGIAIATAAMMLIYIGILLYGTFVLQGVLEEKTSRVMEVMASSVRPFALMGGKILGLGLLGLTSYVSWLLAYVVLITVGAAIGGLDLSMLPMSYIVHLGAFFIGGYFLYAAVFAAAGSLISRIEDAGAAQMPAMILVMGAMFISMFSMQSPDNALATTASFVPFFSPTVMLMRIIMTDVPAWEIATAYLILAGSIVVVTWLASRIYRVGILSYGTRPSLKQVLRFIRS